MAAIMVSAKAIIIQNGRLLVTKNLDDQLVRAAAVRLGLHLLRLSREPVNEVLVKANAFLSRTLDELPVEGSGCAQQYSPAEPPILFRFRNRVTVF